MLGFVWIGKMPFKVAAVSFILAPFTLPILVGSMAANYWNDLEE
jgi:hypothetical protein